MKFDDWKKIKFAISYFFWKSLRSLCKGYFNEWQFSKKSCNLHAESKKLSFFLQFDDWKNI